jgi:hypothetical protein
MLDLQTHAATFSVNAGSRGNGVVSIDTTIDVLA